MKLWKCLAFRGATPTPFRVFEVPKYIPRGPVRNSLLPLESISKQVESAMFTG